MVTKGFKFDPEWESTRKMVLASLEDHLQPIIGGTITSWGLDENDELSHSNWPGHALIIKCTDGKIRQAWVDRDPEGNGSGHLHIIET